jgi:pantothenate kinase-related protein Tda10
MFAHLDDPSLLKVYNIMELEMARKTLRNRDGLNKLIMCLSGSGGSGKSFVLDACRAFCRQFCHAIGKPSMIQFLLFQLRLTLPQRKLKKTQYIRLLD